MACLGRGRQQGLWSSRIVGCGQWDRRPQCRRRSLGRRGPVGRGSGRYRTSSRWYASAVSQEDRTAAALLLGALGATDWVDGWIARRFDQVSEVGKVLDPTADRLLLVVALVAIVDDGSIPVWFAVLVLVREVLIGLAALLLLTVGVRRIDVTWWGKTGTFALLWAVPCFLAGQSTIVAAWAFEAMAWIFGIPGLAISWFAVWGYVLVARSAIQEWRTGS